MKTIFYNTGLTLIFIFTAGSSYGQEPVRTGETPATTEAVPTSFRDMQIVAGQVSDARKNDRIKIGAYEFTATVPSYMQGLQKISTDAGIASDRNEVKEGHKLEVLYEADGYVYFNYWQFKDEALKTKWNSNTFRMDSGLFEQLTKPLYRRYKGARLGGYTVPFRIRSFDDFEFESSLSLQANAVFGFGSRDSQESMVDFSAGIGVTSINLNEKNSDVTEERSATAFTTSIGTVVKFSQFVNFGVFLGMDILGQQDKAVNWKYDEDVWVGLGFNITFTEITTDKSATGNDQDE